MLDSLDVYLKTSATPEFQAAVTEAFELFERFGLENVDVGVEDILMTANDEGEGDVTIRLNALIEELQDHLLAQMQVRVVDEASISEANTIIRGLKLIESTELNSEIVDICREIRDPVEALAEIISRVTGMETERLIILIEEVSPATIRAISDEASKHVLEVREVLDVERDTALMKKFRLYREAMDFQRLFVYDMLQAGVPLNQPYAVYHGKIMTSIQASEEFQAMPQRQREIKTAVQICAGLIIASDTQDAAMRQIVREQLDRTFTDIDTITPIYKEIDSIMIKFNNLTTSGIAKVS